jgi:hypothetical protein
MNQRLAAAHAKNLKLHAWDMDHGWFGLPPIRNLTSLMAGAICAVVRPVLLDVQDL